MDKDNTGEGVVIGVLLWEWYSTCQISIVNLRVLNKNKEGEIQGKWSLSRGKNVILQCSNTLIK